MNRGGGREAPASDRGARDDGPGRLPTVSAVAAVGSGKGGVGKSTVAACLAPAASDGAEP